MTELDSTTTDTYQFPASSPEASLRLVPESSPTETDLARAEAMRQAVSGMHELDSSDVDARRIESFGASTIAVVEGAPTQPERYFNPNDVHQLIACGQHVLRMRQIALNQPPVA